MVDSQETSNKLGEGSHILMDITISRRTCWHTCAWTLSPEIQIQYFMARLDVYICKELSMRLWSAWKFKITGLQEWKAKGKQIITRHAGVCVGYVSRCWQRKEMSSRKIFAKQNNFNMLLCWGGEYVLFKQRKLKRMSNCAKYLHVEKLSAGFPREVKGNTNCITTATVCPILLLSLHFLTLALNIKIFICPLYEEAQAS